MSMLRGQIKLQDVQGMMSLAQLATLREQVHMFSRIKQLPLYKVEYSLRRRSALYSLVYKDESKAQAAFAAFQVIYACMY
jgi:hypothetical protein